VSTAEASAVSVLVLASAGAVPVWALVGWRWLAVVLAPLAGAVIASIAGACALVVAGTIIPWFVGLAGGAAVVSLWAGGRLPLQSPDRRQAPARGFGGNDPLSLRWGARIGALLVLAATAWSLRPLRVPSVGWDARSIWLLRGSWFAGSHGFLAASFHDRAELLAHAGYPPLVSAAVAVSWQATGIHSDRLGVVVIALLNACAAVALGWVLVEAGREAARRTARPRRRIWSLAAGCASGTLLVLAAFGVAGPFATNGYADPLWAFAAAAAVGYGLLLPFDPRHMGAAAVLVLVAGLTKEEGVATAMALVVLIVLRSLAHVRSGQAETPGADPSIATESRSARAARRVAVRRKRVTSGLIGLAVLAAWPVLARLDHAPKDVNTSGPHHGTFWHRAHLTVDSMAPHLHVLMLAVPIAVVGAIVLRSQRRATGLANDAWAWGGLAAGLLVVGWAYAGGGGDTAFWLLTSVHRTTMFPAVTAWLIVGGWVIAATGVVPDVVRQPETAESMPVLVGVGTAHGAIGSV
jgi:hypothetical protein